MDFDKDYVEEICKLGTEECCAYLVCGANGFMCAKQGPLRFQIDLRLAEGSMNAIGDNCDGQFEEKPA